MGAIALSSAAAFAQLPNPQLRFHTNQGDIDVTLTYDITPKTVINFLNYLNKGAGSPRQSSAIDLSHTDLLKGYDYNALINATPDGANARDVRYGMGDLFEDGTRGQFVIKFEF